MIYIGNNKLVDVVVGNKVIKEIYDGNKLLYKKNNDWPGLKFTSKNDNSYVGYQINGDISCDIYYSRDGINWIPWDGIPIYLAYNEFIYVWNKTNTLSISDMEHLQFTMDGSIEASGNTNSMINFSDILQPYCYYRMFIDCGALTTASELPATTLARSCYDSMFTNCSSLTKAPELPATTLAEGCYFNMFANCTNLEQIKIHYTGNFDDNYIFDRWVYGVNKSGTLYYNGSDTTRGDSAIPENFTVLTF